MGSSKISVLNTLQKRVDNLYPTFLRQSFRLFYSTLFIKFIEFLKGLIVLKYLTPEFYGLLNIMKQVTSISKYSDFGFLTVLERECSQNLSDRSAMDTIKNASISMEVGIGLVASLIGLVVAIYNANDLILFFSLACASVHLLSEKILRVFYSIYFVERNFERLLRLNFIVGLISNVLIIILVSTMGYFAPLLIPVFASIITAFYLIRRYRLPINGIPELSEVRRQLSIGLKFGGLTLLTGLGMYSERLFIGELIGLKGIGFLAFASFVTMTFQQLLSQFLKPIIARTQDELFNAGIVETQNIIIKLFFCSIFMGIVGSLGALIAGPLLVNKFAPQHLEGLAFFKQYVFVVYYISTCTVGFILYQKNVDRFFIIYAAKILFIVTIFIGYLGCSGRSDLISTSTLLVYAHFIQTSIICYGTLSIYYKKFKSLFYSIVPNFLPVIYITFQ